MTDVLEVFSRGYGLTVGDSSDVIATIKDEVPEGLQKTYLTTELLNAVRITDLQIKATINTTKRSGKSANDNVVIEVFNLDESTRSFFKEGNHVLLQAGYLKGNGAKLSNLFTGMIVTSTTTKEAEDTVTKITCSATTFVRNNIRVSGFATVRDTYETVIQKLLDILIDRGVPLGNYDKESEGAGVLSKSLPNGFSFDGSIYETLARVCNDIDYRVYMSLGRVYVEPKLNPALIDSVILTDNNIKGTIRNKSDTSGKTASDKENKSGLVVNTFLNGEINPSKLLRLNTTRFSGDYKITSVSHMLDYEGSQWDTTIECVALEGEANV